MIQLKVRVKWLDYFIFCSGLKRLQVHLKHKVKPTGQAKTILVIRILNLLSDSACAASP